jgi:hypothetical protein
VGKKIKGAYLALQWAVLCVRVCVCACVYVCMCVCVCWSVLQKQNGIIKCQVRYLIIVLGIQYQFLQWLGFVFCPQNFDIILPALVPCFLLANFWYLHTTIFEDKGDVIWHRFDFPKFYIRLLIFMCLYYKRLKCRRCRHHRHRCHCRCHHRCVYVYRK